MYSTKFAWIVVALALPAFADGPFEWKDVGNGRIELLEGGKPALVYNYGPQLKPGAPENRRRCCYIFPVYSPAGVSMLDDFPKDHLHHRGIFWAWPVVETEGKKTDLWMEMTVKDRSSKTPTVSAKKGEARLEAHDFWEIDGHDIVKEDVRVTILPVHGQSREMDLELTWEALKAPVTLRGSQEKGKSYGGLCVRFADRQDTTLRADGETLAKDEDRTPRKWAELEAVYGGKRVAVRVTADPTNPGYPHQWTLRNYGFIGASFPGHTAEVESYTLEPGKPLTLKFRVRVTDVADQSAHR